MNENIQLLNVVDEHGRITGTESRETIHRQGLLHREIDIWFYTPDGQIIFQHRAPDKDTNPDLLDATVGGHVEIGADFDDTAVKEVQEETGVSILAKDLRFMSQIHSSQFDPLTGKTNNALQNIYAYRFTGDIRDMTVEPGKAVGFEAWPIKSLFNLAPKQAKRFIFPLIPKWYPEMFRQIETHINEEAGA